MSAWYIFSALGFYPVCPGSDQYAIGSPLVKNATIEFENGKILKIKVVNQGNKNIYVDKIILKGKKPGRLYLTHAELVAGGELTFHMKSER